MYGKKPCHPATFSHTNPLNISFLVFTKCQVLNLRVCRSRDQVLQRAYRGYVSCLWPKFLCSLVVLLMACCSELQVIGNCVVLLVLSSALPVLSRTLGKTCCCSRFIYLFIIIIIIIYYNYFTRSSPFPNCRSQSAIALSVNLYWTI